MDAALEKWKKALPPRAVRTGSSELAVAAEATFVIPRKITAILVPENVAEVATILKIATETGRPVYPYSRGKNWGLGSRLPAVDDCAVVDLSAMDRILDYDPVMGTISVEPGVHFAQVSAFLSEKNSQFYASVTGGSPYGSLIGNALERGGGDGPLGDRAANMAALEVVLGTGEIVHTGYGRFANASTAKLVREGVGISVQDLLAQSNLGVVTKATFWLHRQPAERAYLLLKSERAEDLAAFLDGIRDLLQTDVIYPQSVFVWNAYKALASSRRDPKGTEPRPSVRSTQGIEAWSVTIRVHAADQQILEATITRIRERLQDARWAWTELRKADVSPEMWTQLAPGNPTGSNVLSAYWRKSGALPELEDLDPDRDRCGAIWVCPSLPLDGNVVSSVMRNLERMILSLDFEPNLGFNPVSPRAVEAYVAIMYDIDVPGEDARAMSCHDAVIDWLIAQGHLPYRLGVHSMKRMPKSIDQSSNLIRRLKQAFDPAQIVSPGRYLQNDE